MKRLVGIVGLALLLAACGTSEEVVKESGEKQASAQEDNTEKIAYLHDTLSIGEIDYKVTDAHLVEEISGDVSESGIFLAVEIEVTNHAKEPIPIADQHFTLSLNDATYQYHTNGTMYYEGGFFFKDLNPNMSKTATVVFEVPLSVKEDVSYLIIEPSYYDNVSGTYALIERP